MGTRCIGHRAYRRIRRNAVCAMATLASALFLSSANHAPITKASNDEHRFQSAAAREAAPQRAASDDQQRHHLAPITDAEPAPPPEPDAAAGPPAEPPGPAPSVPGIPASALDAYRRAEDTLAHTLPQCHLTWPLLAGIGKVESGHAHGGDTDEQGNTRSPILGPILDGTNGNAAISSVASDPTGQSGQWTRAMGPMQFLPSTWERWGADATNDGKRDPNNIYDATLGAGQYLCASGDLAEPGRLRAAILSYNHSDQYLDLVLRWISIYSNGAIPIPDQHDEKPDVSQLAAGRAPSSGSSTAGGSGSGKPQPQASGSSGSSPSRSGGGSSSSPPPSSSGGSTSAPRPSGGTAPPPASSPIPPAVTQPVNGVVGGATGALP